MVRIETKTSRAEIAAEGNTVLNLINRFSIIQFRFSDNHFQTNTSDFK